MPGRHVVPWQQPLHEVPSHTHAPATQRWPVPQAAPAPHVQLPVAEQPSPTPLTLQSRQVPPPLPHVVVERVWHVWPLQHPEGHEIPSQMHAPASQRWPGAQGGPPPHEHAPDVQPSARPSQATQAAPPVPHALAVSVVVHTEPLQQPVVHVVLQPAHAPPTHATPTPQLAHAAPPAPHAAAVLPDWHVFPAQQPLHELESHTQAPPTQCWPVAQGPFAPQLQRPASQRSLIAGSQARHCCPGAAHAIPLVGVQTLPAQHPLGHDVASHTHAPPTQRWPAVQAAPPPQLHVPSIAQRSELTVSHAAHAIPGAAHVVGESTSHVAPLQQPLGHDVASHTQAPETQRCPAPHAAPVPHAQLPPTHASARSGSHEMQALPASPHAITLGALHVLPLQQPVGQLAAHPAHAPALHADAPHDSHAPPPAPHAALLVPVWQTLPAQHPVHDVGSQTHAPPTQRWPSAHAPPAPHRHTPPAQPSVVTGSHALHVPPVGPQVVNESGSQTSPLQHPEHEVGSHTQRSETQCCPTRHAGPVPQPHVPVAAHVLASMASQATQLAPPMPQLPSARSRHVAPSQQPAGHDAASHTQRPATQRWPAAHIGLSPHAHVPSSAQVSARVGSHTRQAPPPEPHAIVECGTHVAPVQQPSGQLVASQPEHAPPLQVSPVGHVSQAWPALPHALASLPVRQTSPSQQPVGQLVASHTQAPASQR